MTIIFCVYMCLSPAIPAQPAQLNHLLLHRIPQSGGAVLQGVGDGAVVDFGGFAAVGAQHELAGVQWSAAWLEVAQAMKALRDSRRLHQPGFHQVVQRPVDDGRGLPASCGGLQKLDQLVGGQRLASLAQQVENLLA